MAVRRYRISDYAQLKKLYMHSEWYGNNFTSELDSQERIEECIKLDPDAVLVYEDGGELVGTISLELGRIAWLVRFVVKDNDTKIAKELYEQAICVVCKRGYGRIYIWSPAGNKDLGKRYEDLGLNKADEYTLHWGDIC